jgi:hypothetical protein
MMRWSIIVNNDDPPGEGYRASLVLGPWVSESPSGDYQHDGYYQLENPIIMHFVMMLKIICLLRLMHYLDRAELT